ncbi:hypothetical protein WI37_22390 [Burkholderia ubonensis]|nr:hypothetical protein WI37_22390 [Burkholderia ubonensis]
MDLPMFCEFAIILNKPFAVPPYSTPALRAGLRLAVYANRKPIRMLNSARIVCAVFSRLLETMVRNHMVRRGPTGTAIAIWAQSTTAGIVTSTGYIDVILATRTLAAFR